METLIVIPARGGSKGIPGKNIKPLNGKPLILYTLDIAIQIAKEEDICVSTDDVNIMKVVNEYGFKTPYLRPAELATDYTGMAETLIDALKFYENINSKQYEVVILLQPTSPFRKANHVKDAISLYTKDTDMVVSVCESKANPYYTLFEEDEDGFLRKSKKGNYVRRQDCPKVWEYNGCVYVIKTKSLMASNSLSFKRIIKYQMDEKYSLDIDTVRDWEIVEYLFGRSINKVEHQ